MNSLEDIHQMMIQGIADRAQTNTCVYQNGQHILVSDVLERHFKSVCVPYDIWFAMILSAPKLKDCGA